MPLNSNYLISRS